MTQSGRKKGGKCIFFPPIGDIFSLIDLKHTKLQK